MKAFQKTVILILSIAATSVAFGFTSLESKTDTIQITITQQKQQKFCGLGTSLINDAFAYNPLPFEFKGQLNQLVWQDLKFSILRLWIFPDKAFLPNGEIDISDFEKRYISSGIIADAQKYGASTLLLAPSRLPSFMMDSNQRTIKNAYLPVYANYLAQFIKVLRDKFHIIVHATGISNELNVNDLFLPSQLPIVVTYLRQALDRNGLQNIEIIAPETSSTDATAYAYIDSLIQNKKAWKSLSAVATHSYNMAATKAMADRIAGTSKSYWITEAGDNGIEFLNDTLRAASAACRFLNDVNHFATHWIWFLGYEKEDFRDNATRLLAYAPLGKDLKFFEKYYYLKQLSGIFPIGCRFVKINSSENNEWTYGRKPRISMAAAECPDGKLSLGVCNYTSDSWHYSSDVWEKNQNGEESQRIVVKIYFRGFEHKGKVTFMCISSRKKDYPYKAVMLDGILTLTIEPLELITLHSME